MLLLLKDNLFLIDGLTGLAADSVSMRFSVISFESWLAMTKLFVFSVSTILKLLF